MIKGLTHKKPSFPKIGTLRKGAKKVSDRRPGKDLDDHFRFTSEDKSAEKRFYDVFGNKPERINVFFPHARTDENFDAWVEEWSAGGLVWRGDGERLVLQRTQDGYEAWAVGDESAPAQPTGGKEVGRLKVIIPALRRLGYVTVQTTSINDIMEIHANLAAVEEMRGDLRGVEFVVTRVAREISTPSGKNGGRARRKKWLIHLEADPDWVEAQLLGMQKNAMLTAGSTEPAPLMLTDGDLVDENLIDYGTGEIIEAEPDEDTINPPNKRLFIQFQSAGKAAYNGAWDEIRPKFVAWLTDERTTSSRDLTNAELETGISKLNARIKKNAQRDETYNDYLALISQVYEDERDQREVMEMHIETLGVDNMEVATKQQLESLVAEMKEVFS